MPTSDSDELSAKTAKSIEWVPSNKHRLFSQIQRWLIDTPSSGHVYLSEFNGSTAESETGEIILKQL
jgi:hypothetical protein